MPSKPTPEEMAAALAAAPDTVEFDPDCPPTRTEDWDEAVVSSSLPELREKLAERRHRGPQRAPTKEAISVRLSREVLEHFRATGPGWQGRMDAVLKEWVRTHPEEAGPRR